MQRRRLAAAIATGCLVTALLVLPGQTATAAPPAVANPGFEEPVTGGVIPGWRQTFGTTPAFTVVGDPVRSGSWSVRLVDATATESSGLQSDRFAITAGLSYRVTVAANIQSGSAQIYGYFYNAAGTQVGSASTIVRGTAGTWALNSLALTAPAGSTHASVMLYSPMATITTAYFDDVTVAIGPGTVTRLGTPVNNVAANSAAYGTTPDGRDVVYLGQNGSPAKLAQVDAETGALLAQTDLPGGGGVWALTVAPDGSVYAGTFSTATGSSAPLYRWVPAAGAAVSLGTPLPGENYIWDLTFDEDGNLYGGTYPSGKVFRYDPATGQVRDYGRIAADSQYARSVAWARGKVYIGLGTQRAHLIELDPQTGTTQEISLPAQASAATMLYDLDAHRQFLFARTTDPSALIVYDLSRRTWVADLGAAAGNSVSSPGPDNKVYFMRGGALHSFDLHRGAVEATGFTGLFSARGFGWAHLDTAEFPGNTLVTADSVGRVRLYNPATGARKVFESAAPTNPATLSATAIGPDGRVYVTGYQAGGLSVYDPASGAISQYPRGTVGQAEGMISAFDRLWLGIYPGAHLLEFDPGRPFDYGANPSEPFSLTAQEQDRPFALTTVGDRLAIGTVPTYGKLGGALTLYRPGTGELEVHRDIVADQSVTALTTIGDTVYGGTSVYGGLGTPPAARDAAVFAWDAASGTKSWEVTPIPGERAITTLIAGPNGNLWGITVGMLFELDPATGAVLRTKRLYNFEFTDGYSVWVSAKLGVAPDGTLTAQIIGGTLLSIDPATMSTTELATGVNRPTFAPNGEVYFVRDTDLYVYRPQR